MREESNERRAEGTRIQFQPFIPYLAILCRAELRVVTIDSSGEVSGLMSTFISTIAILGHTELGMVANDLGGINGLI